MTHYAIRLIFFILLFSQLTFFTLAQNKPDSTNKPATSRLERSVSIDREIKSGEVHAYELVLNSKQFARTVIDQRGVDVVIGLFAPDGEQIFEIDSPNGASGLEVMFFVANKSGAYRIEVSPLEKNASGHYEIKVEELRAATPQEIRQDQIKNLAVKLIIAKFARFTFSLKVFSKKVIRPAPDSVEAARWALLLKNPDLVTPELVSELNDYGTLFIYQKNLERASDVINLALEIAQRIKDNTGIADAFYNLGHLSHLQKDYPKAIEYQQKSIRLREPPKDDEKIADSLNVIAFIYKEQKNYPIALEFYQRVLARSQETNDHKLIASTLTNIGYLHQLSGNNAQAFEAYQKSLRFHELAGNKEQLAYTLVNLGAINFFQGNFTPALEHYRKSLKLNRELGYPAKVASSLSRMSNCSLQLGDFTNALDYARESLKISETLGDKEAMADGFLSSGLVYNAMGENARALDFYEKSLVLSGGANNKSMVANALEKIGGSHFLQGDIPLALEYYQKSLKLNEELKDKRQIAFTTKGIGEIYQHQGNYSQALEYFNKSLKVSEEVGNKFQIANAVNGIGIVHANLGSYDDALGYFQKALALREEINNPGGIIDSLNNLGRINFLKGNYEKALEYYQKSLKLSEKISSKGGIRDAQKNIGEVYRLQGNYAQALEYSQKSLAISEQMGSKLVLPEILTDIGNIYLSKGDYSLALEYAGRAAAAARQTENRYYLWNALVLAGKAYQPLKQFDKSRQAFEEAINTIELSRTKIAGQEIRTSYFATVQQPYELYIDLLMQLHRQNPTRGYNVQALQVSERARARSLLELLSESNTDIRQSVDSELVFRESLLQEQLNTRAEQQIRLLSGNHTEEQAAALKKEIIALTDEYQNLEAQIRQQSPHYDALTKPIPLKLSEIQKEVLDSDTILLHYALGETRSYLWAVTKDSAKSYELPSRSEIEKSVKKAYSFLSEGMLTLDDKARIGYDIEAARLSKILLAPVAVQLQNKRILIVADGALQYLPFGVLPSPTAKAPGQPLIVENEIISIPSISAISMLRRQIKGRIVAAKSIAVIADPVFSSDDERVKTATGNSPGLQPQTSPQPASIRNFMIDNAARKTGLLRDGSIQRLPFSRRESESILAIAPTGDELQALNFDANRTTALNPVMSQYRIIHFATHGLLDGEQPQLSGIILSLVREDGSPVDGFLRLNEIYNLNLAADLVVLSACQTALGKEVRGEGLIGLTRGFMYAGAPRVVASLWKVDDAATAELMKLFYEKMLKGKMRPAAALRAAKVEMWKQKRWNAPFFWAAFEIQGEWR